MKRFLTITNICALVFLVSGCAGLVADEIENAKLKPVFSKGSVDELYKIINVSTRDYCSSTTSFCTQYLYSAASPAQPTDTNTASTSEYGLKLTSSVDSGSKVVEKVLLLDEQLENQYQGTVLLLHGHGGDKNIWAFTISYFHYLGFDVVAPDLPGHGEANSQRSYGVADGREMADFISTELKDAPRPLIVVGHSMGALAAVNAARESQAADGLVLLAPMQRFDKASLGVAQTFSPWLNMLVPDSSIEAGAELALTRGGVTMAQTDMLPAIPLLGVPTLVYGAQTDPVSNISNEGGWQYPHVQRYVNDEESHVSPIMVGQKEHEMFVDWFENIPGIISMTKQESVSE
ncbi:alpha/beta hydrolase [Salinimonas sp. HHU 13199]|uniref:Alpha/beta hydrolase n=1 Tax=Salinimonas profundi TaxID=2729140 RepID=A0ABR8LFH1_9ALTE|nr:alpha/beta fold hydrolase [Salinimonas profundi]MBD3585002.1 alpha/beta hydrolase [Salinimonas profundi]